ncbi:serine/threonine-protein kinase [Streptomyces longispororuber]|uniref:serine/threonine-protein kinase n=1 Tax=Streptomyces longispororuber TaxID=68230 RepID=UPI0033EC3B4A
MHPLEPDEPTAIGPYRLLGRLGSGGMGRVYVGRSAGGRTVAVKIVHPHFALDGEFRARFRREVEAARRVGGDWTAPVLDADPEAAVPWVATGYAAGPSLAQAVRDTGPLPEHSVRVLVAGLAEALAHVHGLGLVHRDVKPSNVLLTMDGPRLIDFGIARAIDGTASLTSTGVSVGSPGYMAPEQILGEGVTGAADVFSLGAVLVYAATGTPPFPGDSSAALLYKVVHEAPELGSLTGDLRDIAASCLAKDAGARPAPADLARRLAPAGAAPLVAAGWLPGPVVERVGRGAVRLLDLDTGSAEPPAASGPVPLPGTAAGEFGPPDPSYAESPYGESSSAGSPNAAGSRYAAGAAHAAGSAHAAGPPRPGGSSYGDGDGGEPAPGPSYGDKHSSAAEPVAGPPALAAGAPTAPGRFSLSVAADAAPARADGRGRRVSCTVALAVAGALAAVTVGAVFVLDLLPGGGDSAKDGGGRPPAATGGTPQEGAVPARYLGEWSGDAFQKGRIPIGTFDVTLRQAARPGARLGTMTQTDLIGNTCVDVLTFKSATDKELVATGTGAETNGGQCSRARHTVRLRPVGPELQYTSEDAKAGNPQARLKRTGR